MGSFTRRELLIERAGRSLPKVEVADDEEVLHFVSKAITLRTRDRVYRCSFISGRSAHAGHAALDARQTAGRLPLASIWLRLSDDAYRSGGGRRGRR